MGRLEVTIASNGLEARLRVRPGPAATVDDMRRALASAGVVHGIDEDSLVAIAERAKDPRASFTETVACGTKAVDGEDGCLRGEMLERHVSGTTDASGRIDHRERRTLRPAAVGQAIAEIVAPTNGTPGRAVDGRELASRPGRPHAQRHGPGVRIQGSALVASRDGVLFATDRDIDVVTLYTHRGHVDTESGNLHSNGSLRIEGDVRDGCTATADGDITITGFVQGSGVTAGGSVSIDRGVLGHDHVVRAGADITCHHATSARLVANRSIEIGDNAAQTSLQAPSIRIVEGRGAVRGGELRARDRIEVGSAGSPSGTATTLAVGDLLDEQVALARQTVATSRLDRAAARQTGPGTKRLRAAVRAGDDERVEQLRLKKRREEVLRTASILITRTCHPGVVLKFGSAELCITDTTGPGIYHFDGEDRSIVRGELQ